jgi:hypothetical protein
MLGSKGTLLVAGADYTVLNDSDTVAGLVKPRTSIAIVGGDELFAWDTAKIAFEVL